MNNSIIKDIIKSCLIEISFEERYITLCNKFNDYENCKKVKNSEIKKILDDVEFPMKSVAKESIFIKDYNYEKFQLRFILPYKDGIIDCSDLYWDEDNSIRIYGGFRMYIQEINPDIKKHIKYLSPIAISSETLKEIIKDLIHLHQDFIDCFSVKYGSCIRNMDNKK